MHGKNQYYCLTIGSKYRFFSSVSQDEEDILSEWGFAVVSPSYQATNKVFLPLVSRSRAGKSHDTTRFGIRSTAGPPPGLLT